MARVAHVIALQGIFGILLLSTRYLADRSPVILVRGGETFTPRISLFERQDLMSRWHHALETHGIHL